ncbi:thiol-disulfide oxidoreductase DCC family protein [Pararhodonellum marinum]|uniref:thiol-disulfide oxidoreductase DCC family protein n=1 Tax=Pararhodonellum marinum TaxID=2755358 RepID=UPI00188DF01B|nr:DCC1-like thiol-disulfide oxidoreductase family protein [Pararhodonellum marinum]
MSRLQDAYGLILFDGVCNLCNHAVDFILKRDKARLFKFGSLQDQKVQEILKNFSIKGDFLDSIVLIQGDKVYYKSRAALEISKKLKGLWPLFYIFILVPVFIRDPVYDWVARNRYRWFGKNDTCRIPTPEEKEHFIT